MEKLEMIDFTECRRNGRGFDGGNGRKIGIIYNQIPYMLKFNDKKPGAGSYTNSDISEYLGCHIFESIGIPAQRTLLGIYRHKETTYHVVACEDFRQNGFELMEFSKIKNGCFSSSSNGYGTELSDILDAIDEQSYVDSAKMKSYFWKMFIGDALIGNFDRHNGNWGILWSDMRESAKLAPIYDCGSSLYPQANEKAMEKILADENEINKRIFVFPQSAIKENGEKINYFDFISSLKNEDCNEALKKIGSRINMTRIRQIIDEAPGLTGLQRRFYKTMLEARKERIIDFSLGKYRKLEKETSPAQPRYNAEVEESIQEAREIQSGRRKAKVYTCIEDFKNDL